MCSLPSLVVAYVFSGSTCEEEEDETNEIEVVLVLEVLSCSPRMGWKLGSVGACTISITTMGELSKFYYFLNSEDEFTKLINTD